MGKQVWLKIIVFIIIQALLLTQAESALAAICHSKDTFQEAALKFQRVTNKTTSLINGIGCLQLNISSLHLPNFNLKTLFNLLKGSNASLTEIKSVRELRVLNNEIYKALIFSFDNFKYSNQIWTAYKSKEDKREIIKRARVEESTGPPISTTQVMKNNDSRIREISNSVFLLSTLFKEQRELNNMCEIIPPILSKAKWRDQIQSNKTNLFCLITFKTESGETKCIL